MNTSKRKGFLSTGRIILWIGGLAGAAWLLYTYRGVVAPLVIAALLAYILTPLVALIERLTKWNRTVVVPIVYILMVAALVTLIVVYVPAVISEAQYFSLEFYRFMSRLDSFTSELERIIGITLPYEDQEMTSFLESQAELLFHPERLYRLVNSVSSNAIWVLVVIVASFYFLKDGGRLQAWLVKYMPSDRQEEVDHILVEIKNIWQSYLQGRLLVIVIVGILSGLSAWMLGMRGALFLGFLAGTLDIIPVVGPAVATGVAGFIAWDLGTTTLPISNEWLVVLVVLIFTAIQVIENAVLNPLVMNHRLELHPGLVFVAVIASVTYVGVLMALIIVPLLASIIYLLRYLRWGKTEAVESVSAEAES
jgi:predicted PurR-regulated permease PerM